MLINLMLMSVSQDDMRTQWVDGENGGMCVLSIYCKVILVVDKAIRHIISTFPHNCHRAVVINTCDILCTEIIIPTVSAFVSGWICSNPPRLFHWHWNNLNIFQLLLKWPVKIWQLHHSSLLPNYFNIHEEFDQKGDSKDFFQSAYDLCYLLCFSFMLLTKLCRIIT